MDQNEVIVTVILGAGSSRDVSYATGETCVGSDLGPTMPSPLDGDFFDLLQRLEAQTEDGTVKEAMRSILNRVFEWRGEPIWQSMEKMFYNLHVSAMLDHKLFAPGPDDPVKKLVDDFLVCIRTLLDAAHGTRACQKHWFLLQNLYAKDAIITFNYDFVAERMLAGFHGGLPSIGKPFGDWFYGFRERPNDAPNDIPTLYKLHGSLNWELEEDDKGEIQSAKEEWPKTWNEFDKELEYLPTVSRVNHADERQRPPILLPYWDKRVEKGLWLKIWRGAAEQLRRTHSLIVWGYSLPTTDLKSRELLRLAFQTPAARLGKVAVIDTSRDTQDRWRSMFVKQQFWRFRDFDEFYGFLHRQNSNLGPFRNR